MATVHQLFAKLFGTWYANEAFEQANVFWFLQPFYLKGRSNNFFLSLQFSCGAGLTNSASFTEIQWIRSPPNFKIDDFTVH
jgi:hypothetical protein